MKTHTRPEWTNGLTAGETDAPGEQPRANGAGKIRFDMEKATSGVVAGYLKDAGLKAMPRRSPEYWELWDNRRDEIYANPEVFANHPSETVTHEAISSPNEAWSGLPIACLAWIEQNGHGTIAKRIHDENWTSYRPVGAKLWEAAAARVVKDLAQNNTILSPLAVEMIEDHIDAGAGDWLDRTDGKGALPMAPGLEDAGRTFAQWAKSMASAEDILEIRKRNFLPTDGLLWEVLIKNTPHVMSREAIQLLAPTLDYKTAMLLLNNPHLTHDGAHTILLWALVGKLPDYTWGSASTDRIFTVARKRGFHLTPDMVMIAKLKLLSSEKNEASNAILADIPEIASDSACREKLLAANQLEGIHSLIIATQGNDWLELVRYAVGPEPETRVQGSLICKWMEETESWNLEGVTRTDLVPLINHQDARLRRAFTGIMAKITRTRKEAEPSAPGGRRTV